MSLNINAVPTSRTAVPRTPRHKSVELQALGLTAKAMTPQPSTPLKKANSDVEVKNQETIWGTLARQIQHQPDYLGFYLKGIPVCVATARLNITPTTWWKLCLCRVPKDRHETELIESALQLDAGTVIAAQGLSKEARVEPSLQVGAK